MSITDELIEALQQVVDSASLSKRDNPAMFSAWEHARETLAKARALQQAPPTTVIGWLELARDAGLPWAESAIEQCDICQIHANSLADAVMWFATWDDTSEEKYFWADIRIAELDKPTSAQALHEMARARKEAQ